MAYEVVDNPERLLNMHFFGPVWERPMVELMTCGQTSDAVFAAADQDKAQENATMRSGRSGEIWGRGTA